MCPPLSCCYGRSPGRLPTLLYHLSRLLLADPDALTAGQARRLSARLDSLWHHYHTSLQGRFGQHWLYTPELASQLVMALLETDCCRQALHRTVPLAEALGSPGPQRWALRRHGLRARMSRPPAA